MQSTTNGRSREPESAEHEAFSWSARIDEALSEADRERFEWLLQQSETHTASDYERIHLTNVLIAAQVNLQTVRDLIDERQAALSVAPATAQAP